MELMYACKEVPKQTYSGRRNNAAVRGTKIYGTSETMASLTSKNALESNNF
jgi:hypothetical protein